MVYTSHAGRLNVRTQGTPFVVEHFFVVADWIIEVLELHFDSRTRLPTVRLVQLAAQKRHCCYDATDAAANDQENYNHEKHAILTSGLLGRWCRWCRGRLGAAGEEVAVVAGGAVGA
jgi:hypothetical protein